MLGWCQWAILIRPLILYDDWPQGVYPLRKDSQPGHPKHA